MKRRDSLSLHPAPPSRTDDETRETDMMKMMRMVGFMMLDSKKSKILKTDTTNVSTQLH
jgi:hypothetical protein